MSARLTVNIDGLKKLAAHFDNPTIKAELRRLPQERAIAALVGQAIADNFAKQGPGWAPLKPETIRRSVAKRLRKSLADMTDKELLKHEAKARKASSKSTPYRQILRKTGLLYKTATIPSFAGSNKTGQAGGNIWRTEGTNLIWGSSLVYAGVHQKGNSEMNIPARPYLTIRDQWLKKIYQYVLERTVEIVGRNLFGSGA